MPSALNAINCITTGANTGTQSCAIELKNISDIFILPSGYKITISGDALSFLATLTTATFAASGTRIFPIHNLVQIADNTEDSVIQSFNNGAKGKVRNGFWDVTLQILKGGNCLLSKLYKFDGQDIDILCVDSSGLVFGNYNSDGTLSGIPLALFDVKTPKINDGTKLTENAFRVNANPSFFQSLGFVQCTPAGVLAVKGLVDVKLAGTRTTNVGTITGTIGCAKTDLYATYGSALAKPTAWVVTDGLTGANLTITSVAVDTNVGGYTTTLDTTDPDYSAGHSQVYSLVAPTALAVLAPPVPGIESNTFTAI